MRWRNALEDDRCFVGQGAENHGRVPTLQPSALGVEPCEELQGPDAQGGFGLLLEAGRRAVVIGIGAHTRDNLAWGDAASRRGSGRRTPAPPPFNSSAAARRAQLFPGRAVGRCANAGPPGKRRSAAGRCRSQKVGEPRTSFPVPGTETPRTRQDGAIALLILINGAPGVGKSSLGRRYLSDHPLALLLDIDTIRAALGSWREVEESKVAARDLAVAMADTHLRAGHEVVVPQYVGRPEFAAVLRDTARRCGARFVEVLLDAPAAVAVERFRAHRRDLIVRGEEHPRAEVSDDEVQATVDDARANLARHVGSRGDLVRVQADQGLDDTYAEFITKLGAFR